MTKNAKPSHLYLTNAEGKALQKLMRRDTVADAFLPLMPLMSRSTQITLVYQIPIRNLKYIHKEIDKCALS